MTKNQETETKQNHNIKCEKCQANLYSIFMVYSVQDLLRINYTSLWITLRIYKQQTHTTHDEWKQQFIQIKLWNDVFKKIAYKKLLYLLFVKGVSYFENIFIDFILALRFLIHLPKLFQFNRLYSDVTRSTKYKNADVARPAQKSRS